MELESINRIFQTEQKANEILENAKEQAEQLIKNAIDSQESKELFAKKRVNGMRQTLEQKVKDENTEKIREIAEFTEQERILHKAKNMHHEASRLLPAELHGLTEVFRVFLL